MKSVLWAVVLAIAVAASAQTVSVTCTGSGDQGTGVLALQCKMSSPTPPPTTATPMAPVISSFSVSPQIPEVDQTATLSWTVTGETSLTLTICGDSTSVLGKNEISGTFLNTETLTLTASNSVGSVSKTLTVTPSAVAIQPPPVSQPTSTAPTGGALNACGDLTSSGSYYLANDVSSTGTCFGIDADNITLNLNGHTITYGTGGGTTPTPAIEGHDSWWMGSPNYVGDSYSGSAHGGLEVYGGTIVQSKNSAPFSPVFSFGEGTFSSAPYIHDITATFQNQGAAFYYSAYLPPGARIENNTIYDNVTNIQFPGQGVLSARSAFQGQAILIDSTSNNPGSGDVISGNKIVGSPQGGVRSTNQNTLIENNDISMNAIYSNDFCADIPADGQVVKDNNCHPVSGRGFHINAGSDTVSNNTITVTELKQNAEYNGCELGGAYGVQLEDDPYQHNSPVGSTISGNTIVAKAGDCNAVGFRVTGLSATSGGTFTGNTVTTSNTRGAGQDFSIDIDGSDDPGVSITGNSFQSDYSYVGIDWDGGNITVGDNEWNGSPKFSVVAGDGGCAPGQADSEAVCPVSVSLNDDVPNSVSCLTYSTAAVTINGENTQCHPQ